MTVPTAGNVRPFISSLLLLWVWVWGAQAQNPNLNRSNHWYFGFTGAGVDFGTGTPVADVSGAIMSSAEGCATMSDTGGNLLFYTDGMTVWNKLHQPMAPVGLQLGGDPSATNSAVAFPQPLSSERYYIITVGSMYGDIRWSTVDMGFNGGLGQITGSNIPLAHATSEKLAVTETCDRSNYWAYGFRAHDGNLILLQDTPSSNGIDSIGKDGQRWGIAGADEVLAQWKFLCINRTWTQYRIFPI